MTRLVYYITTETDEGRVETEVTAEQYAATTHAAGFRIELGDDEPEERESKREFERAIPPPLETR